MTSAVSRSASAISTWLPGIWGLPSACRSKASTMLILTNAVSMSTPTGASETRPKSATVCTVRTASRESSIRNRFPAF